MDALHLACVIAGVTALVLISALILWAVFTRLRPEQRDLLARTDGRPVVLAPPSHNAVLYSLATGGAFSISALLMAGIFPGLLLGFSRILLCTVFAYREDLPHSRQVPAKDAVKITIDRWPDAAIIGSAGRRKMPLGPYSSSS
ncbi:TRAP transporter large permease subunit [Bradyrhizobium sp. HKCCYLRH3061]|uniref:TRAP transporter large permease subunit n=1 Tax=Bradyrhizobium sp. HKCCYLRH3061 TaxID=3420734 RepID=UPI003EBE38BD